MHPGGEPYLKRYSLYTSIHRHTRTTVCIVYKHSHVYLYTFVYKLYQLMQKFWYTVR